MPPLVSVASFKFTLATLPPPLVGEFSTDAWFVEGQSNLLLANATYTSATVDSVGNVYLAGHAADTSTGVVVTKLANSGQVLWSGLLSRNVAVSVESITDIAVDSLGDIYIGGTMLAKLNTDGVLQWAREMGSTDILSLAVDDTHLFMCTDQRILARVVKSTQAVLSKTFRLGTVVQPEYTPAKIRVANGTVYTCGTLKDTGYTSTVVAFTSNLAASFSRCFDVNVNMYNGSQSGYRTGEAIAVSSTGEIYQLTANGGSYACTLHKIVTGQANNVWASQWTPNFVPDKFSVAASATCVYTMFSTSSAQIKVSAQALTYLLCHSSDGAFLWARTLTHAIFDVHTHQITWKNGFLYACGFLSNGAAFACKLPDDGSKLGTYGGLIYGSTAYTTTYIASMGTLSISTTVTQVSSGTGASIGTALAVTKATPVDKPTRVALFNPYSASGLNFTCRNGYVYALYASYGATDSVTSSITVMKLTSTLVPVWEYGITLAVPVYNPLIQSICVDELNNVYVLANNRVVKFDSSGAVMWANECQAVDPISLQYRNSSLYIKAMLLTNSYVEHPVSTANGLTGTRLSCATTQSYSAYLSGGDSIAAHTRDVPSSICDLMVSRTGATTWSLGFKWMKVNSIAQDSSDNVYISGTKYSGYNVATGGFVIKISPAGSVVWNIELSGQPAFVSISNDSVFVSQPSNLPPALIKYTLDGTLAWKKQVNYPAVFETTDGIYVSCNRRLTLCSDLADISDVAIVESRPALVATAYVAKTDASNASCTLSTKAITKSAASALQRTIDSSSYRVLAEVI